MGFSAMLKGMIASIIGGIGSIPGAMVADFFLGLVEYLGIWKIQAGWEGYDWLCRLDNFPAVPTWRHFWCEG
jgi:branched-subunit amino acid ABC-type transport system permease component